MEPTPRDTDLVEPRRRDRIQAVVPSHGHSSGSSAVPSLVRTRNRLLDTRMGRERFVRRPQALAADVHPSLVARRKAYLEFRRRRRPVLWFLIAAGILFPPILAVYLLAWLFVRRKPEHRSMRRVRKGIKALEQNHAGIALRQFQEAHLLDPSNNDALYWLGLLLADQHRYGEAAEALSLVSERLPGLPEVESALLEASAETGDYDEAIHHAQILLDIDPYDLTALVRLANCFEATGRRDLAIETLQHAPLYKRTLTDDLKLVHYRLGELYERSGDLEKARQHYRRVQAADLSFLDVRSKLPAPTEEPTGVKG
ncbi:MAG TPA: tetratricopeptide repeat protein [Rhodothermales bacterium]|nr:tetratricopeptide repeat protein [Rhodothermales bacterium]